MWALSWDKRDWAWSERSDRGTGIVDVAAFWLLVREVEDVRRGGKVVLR